MHTTQDKLCGQSLNNSCWMGGREGGRGLNASACSLPLLPCRSPARLTLSSHTLHLTLNNYLSTHPPAQRTPGDPVQSAAPSVAAAAVVVVAAAVAAGCPAAAARSSAAAPAASSSSPQPQRREQSRHSSPPHSNLFCCVVGANTHHIQTNNMAQHSMTQCCK